MSPPKTQQSDSDRNLPTDESSAATPKADEISPDLTEVDALLDQVEGLAQDIVEDVEDVEDAAETPVAATPSNESLDSEAADLSETLASDSTIDASDLSVSESVAESASELPPVLELDDAIETAPTSDEDTSVILDSDAESQAILDSLQAVDDGEGQSPIELSASGIESVGLENTLVLADDEAEPSETVVHSTVEQDGAQIDEIVESLPAVDASDDEPLGGGRMPTDTDDDEPVLADLLHDPDSELVTDDAMANGERLTVDVDSDEPQESEAAAIAAREFTAPTMMRRRQRRIFRVARIVQRRLVRRVWGLIRQPKRVVNGAFAIPRMVVRASDSILIWLDRPFTGVSEQRKQLIGLIALVTLFGGVLLWTLPYVFYSNPFDGMTTGIASVK